MWHLLLRDRSRYWVASYCSVLRALVGLCNGNSQLHQLMKLVQCSAATHTRLPRHTLLPCRSPPAVRVHITRNTDSCTRTGDLLLEPL